MWSAVQLQHQESYYYYYYYKNHYNSVVSAVLYCHYGGVAGVLLYHYAGVAVIFLWHHNAVVAAALLQHYEAVVAVVIVYDNCGVVAVASGAHEALKSWAAGLRRLEGGCTVALLFIGCCAFCSGAKYTLTSKAKWERGGKQPSFLKNPCCIYVFHYMAQEQRRRGSRGRAIERRMESTGTDCVITVFTLNTQRLKGLGWITATSERQCLCVYFCVSMYVMVTCSILHRSPSLPPPDL